jgi:hypothetical protein
MGVMVASSVTSTFVSHFVIAYGPASSTYARDPLETKDF